MKFKRLIEEQNRLECLKTKEELTDYGLEMLAELNQALQLLQTDVVGRSEQLCDFEHHNVDIRRAYTCSECGGRKLK